jgi:hypothetical protein
MWIVQFSLSFLEMVVAYIITGAFLSGFGQFIIKLKNDVSNDFLNLVSPSCRIITHRSYRNKIMWALR